MIKDIILHNNSPTMWYLYTLSYKNSEFYVGISKNPINRFIQHRAKGGGHANVWEYIYWIIERGEYKDISLNIIAHFCDRKRALESEATLIKYFVAKRHKLCNWDHNHSLNQLITCRPSKQLYRPDKMPVHIITAVDDYHFRLTNNWKIENRFNASLYANKRN